MTKYWNPRRLKRIREREAKVAERAAEAAKLARERAQTYAAGDSGKNTRLMLHALGSPTRRRMLSRLLRGGAMSLSKLTEPFRLTLPSGYAHLRILEQSGLVTTHKRGRVRMCMYRPRALDELAANLRSGLVEEK